MTLKTAIPDAKVLLALPPEELGGKIIFWLRHRQMQPCFHFGNLMRELYGGPDDPYPSVRREDVLLVLSEAWSWLETQGLLARGMDDHLFYLTRRAKTMEVEADFQKFKTARLLPREILHPKIAEPVWLAFMRGEFDVAVFQAMKAVEVSVRDAAGFGTDLIGVPLMNRAFAPNPCGPLTDEHSEGGERQARMLLFAGAIGSYKNPHSHRDVNLDNPAEALEIILLANHLLRIVDSRTTAAGIE